MGSFTVEGVFNHVKGSFALRAVPAYSTISPLLTIIEFSIAYRSLHGLIFNAFQNHSSEISFISINQTITGLKEVNRVVMLTGSSSLDASYQIVLLLNPRKNILLSLQRLIFVIYCFKKRGMRAPQG